MNHLMIDIETLDIRPSAVVFQVAAVAFDEQTVIDERLWHLDILEQVIAGRTINESAVKFWQDQDDQAWKRACSEIMPTRYAFQEINSMMADHGISWVWSNSPSFDAVIMRSLRESLKIPHEFPGFRTDMDMRTLKSTLNSLGKMNGFLGKTTTHNALKDCRDQIETVQFMLKTLRQMNEA